MVVGDLGHRLAAAGNAVCADCERAATAIPRPEVTKTRSGDEYVSGTAIRAYLTRSGILLRKYAQKFAALEAPADQRAPLDQLVQAFRQFAVAQQRNAEEVPKGRVSTQEFLGITLKAARPDSQKTADAARTAMTTLGFTTCLGTSSSTPTTTSLARS